MAQSPPLRTVLLLNDETVDAWQAEAIAQLLKSGHSDVILILVRAETPPIRRRFSQRLTQLLPSGKGLWQVYAKLATRRSRASRSTSLPPGLEGVPVRTVVVRSVGKGAELFPDDAIEALRQARPDVIVRFGFGILKGDVLSCARFGVWSYHHGDPSLYRGQPPGFWEMYDRQAVTGAVLQHLNERLDAGWVLHAGHFKTIETSYSRQLDQVLTGSASWLTRTFAQVRISGRLPGHENAVLGKVRTKPRNTQMIAFVLGALWRGIVNRTAYLLFQQNWTIGLKRGDLSTVLRTPSQLAEDVVWRKPSKSVFLADPFIVPGANENRVDVLAELYDWNSANGSICSLRYDPQAGFSEPHTVYAPPYHCSYPSVFTEPSGAAVCVPETSAAGATRMFSLHGGWSNSGQTIARGVVDPTFIHRDGKLWMFCTLPGERTNVDLHLFYATVMSGPWTPHPLNPVKTDIRSARPAGNLVESEGDLLRPAQDCSLRYGGAIRLQRVAKLSETEFEEHDLFAIEPADGSSFPYGLHTINGANGWIVIDGARREFIVRDILRRIGNR